MKKKAVLGIDVGGTKVGVGLVSEEGELIDSVRYPQRYCPIEAWTEELSERIGQMISSNGDGISVEAMGIGSRGHIDFKNQRLLHTTIMEVSSGYDLCGELKRRFGYPVYIDNDVKAAACGELLFGAGREYRDFICYNIGTGIAVSMVTEGRLVRGRNNDAGEICSDFVWNPSGACAHQGLEQIASGRGIETEARKGLEEWGDSSLSALGEHLSTKDILQAWREEDELACRVVKQAFDALAGSIVNLRHLANPEAFIFVGGVVSDQSFFEGLKKRVAELSECIGEKWDVPLRVTASGIHEIGILGAASVALYNWDS